MPSLTKNRNNSSLYIVVLYPKFKTKFIKLMVKSCHVTNHFRGKLNKQQNNLSLLIFYPLCSLLVDRMKQENCINNQEWAHNRQKTVASEPPPSMGQSDARYLFKETWCTTFTQGVCPSTAVGLAIELSLLSPNHYIIAYCLSGTVYVWTNTIVSTRQVALDGIQTRNWCLPLIRSQAQ